VLVGAIAASARFNLGKSAARAAILSSTSVEIAASCVRRSIWRKTPGRGRPIPVLVRQNLCRKPYCREPG